MAVYFFDSSALVKRHVDESGSAWVRSLTRVKAGHTLYIARITAVEVTSAVARRRKGRTITSKKASSILHRFRQHLAGRVPDTQAFHSHMIRLRGGSPGSRPVVVPSGRGRMGVWQPRGRVSVRAT